MGDDEIEKLIDVCKYLSVDNGKGILLRKEEVKLLQEYGIDFYDYDSLSMLLRDLDSIVDDDENDSDIEDLIDRLKEMHYYNETNK